MTLESIAYGARLTALRELGVLDTAPEPDFDRFTSLAAELLGVPASAVTLVDRDRQLHKSAIGLEGTWAEARQAPLIHSFCKYPVASGEPLVVGDARSDPRMADTLAVRDMSVVAYAGIPLVLADGDAVGTMCAIDTEPREWSERDLRILSDLAAAVSTMLDLRRTLNQQSLHDTLTGLPNRTLTFAYCEQLSTAGDAGELLALAIGIEGVGAVNEGYGTAHGDRMINLLARRIAHQLSTDDVLGRLQGDIFVVLRPRVADPLEAVDLAHRIRSAISAEPISIRGEQLGISAAVGLATASAGRDGDALIVRALESLTQAKRANELVAVSQPRSGADAAARIRLRGALTGAIRRGEIAVDFQPIVELATGRVHSYEALARWHHPELGLVGPAAFIPEAESTGDIVPIGEHVLRTACTQLALWRQMAPQDDLHVTVNFSPLQLAVANIAEVVEAILQESGLPAYAVTLELTEGVFISPGALQRRNLEAIRELGVQLALDDFGTGYSALSYLKRFPVDVIKVDRCFLDGLETDRRDAALMRGILAIGTGMELEVVAEGIETEAQRELLHLSGCQWGQGYLFSEPLPPEQIRLTGLAPTPMLAD